MNENEKVTVDKLAEEAVGVVSDILEKIGEMPIFISEFLGEELWNRVEAFMERCEEIVMEAHK